MIKNKIIAYLEKLGVPHQILEHKKVYTAFDKAQTLGEKLDKIVKVLMVKAGKSHHLVLLPANQMLDFKKLAKALASNEVKVVSEKNMLDLLAGQPAALHVFASLYDMPLVVEKSLAKLKEAIFPSGSFEHSLKMKLKDFLKAEEAMVAVFGVKKKLPRLALRSKRAKPVRVKKVKKIKKVVKAKKPIKKAVKKITKKKKK